MGRPHHRRLPALLLALALVLAACRADAGSEELDLVDGDVDASSAEEPPADGDGADDSSAEEPGELFPPLPALEPNPDSDVPVDLQRAFLDLHAQVYEVIQTAYHTGRFDRNRLAVYLSDPLLDSLVSSLERRAAQGVVSRSPDTTVAWVEVMSAAGGPAVVHECVLVGPATGHYDIETGEPVETLGDPAGVIFETTYDLVELADGRFEHRAVSLITGSDPERCDV